MSKIVDHFAKNPTDRLALELIEEFRITRNAESIANLATTLANSGQRFSWEGPTADIASTGGPSSLSTLLSPLFLVASRFDVPKLGIQGRPAGGIDVMAQIGGFDIDPSPSRVQEIVKECGFAHFLAGNRYAPLDQYLFKLRQQSNAQSIPGLVTASILSKKIALGVKVVGLDVRVFAGANFGETAAEAAENAKLFIEVANLLGIQATCFVTDARAPFQPYIGRGEALIALYKLFNNLAPSWLKQHASDSAHFAQFLSDKDRANLNDECDISMAWSVFQKHLLAHGASAEQFVKAAHRVMDEPYQELLSPCDGIIAYQATGIRDFILRHQSSEKATKFSDAAGVVLLKRPGENVSMGEPVMQVRIPKSQALPLADELIWITDKAVSSFQTIIVS